MASFNFCGLWLLLRLDKQRRLLPDPGLNLVDGHKEIVHRLLGHRAVPGVGRVRAQEVSDPARVRLQLPGGALREELPVVAERAHGVGLHVVLAAQVVPHQRDQTLQQEECESEYWEECC